MIKAIIFDAGGVLFKNKGEVVYTTLAKKLGIDKSEFDEASMKYFFDAQKGLISTKNMISNMARDLNLDETMLLKRWQETYAEVMILNEEALRLIDSLKKNGYVTALMTNTIELYSTINKSRNNFSKFYPIVMSWEVGARKPEEKIYKIMLDKLKLKPEECVFLDDREQNVISATNMGLKVILVKRITQLKKDLKKLGIKI